MEAVSRTRGSGDAEYRCDLSARGECPGGAVGLSSRGKGRSELEHNAGRRTHQGEVRLRGAGDRADNYSKLPNIAPITKHRQWAQSAADAGVDGEDDDATAAAAVAKQGSRSDGASRVQGALQVACRYQKGMQTIRRNLQCLRVRVELLCAAGSD